MTPIILVLHILVCILLILVVLLQAGKGADMGATFGAGGSQSLFGTGGAAPFLTKITTACAVIFMVTSITLTILSAKEAKKTVVQSVMTPATPSTSVPSTTTPMPEAPIQNPTPTK